MSLTRNSTASAAVGPRGDDVVVGGGDRLDLFVDPVAVSVGVAHRRHQSAGGRVGRVERRAERIDGYLETITFWDLVPSELSKIQKRNLFKTQNSAFERNFSAVLAWRAG